MSFLKGSVGLSALSLLLVAAHGQRPMEVVKWTAMATQTSPSAATVTLSATIQDGWHVYSLTQPPGGPTPRKISVPAGASYEIDKPAAEIKLTRHGDPSFKMVTFYYLNAMDFRVPMKKTAAALATTIPVDVRFQACNDRLCLPPYTAHLTATLERK